jgi:hypothetical protein
VEAAVAQRSTARFLLQRWTLEGDDVGHLIIVVCPRA